MKSTSVNYSSTTKSAPREIIVSTRRLRDNARGVYGETSMSISNRCLVLVLVFHDENVSTVKKVKILYRQIAMPLLHPVNSENWIKTLFQCPLRPDATTQPFNQILFLLRSPWITDENVDSNLI